MEEGRIPLLPKPNLHGRILRILLLGFRLLCKTDDFVIYLLYIVSLHVFHVDSSIVIIVIR